ncbi:MAG: DUF4386 domain-containing protein [Deltaproteobacteria bacterium]|nr:MAG: DUF4386 domain-containing protein [Deltaproteobacteria bacterium]
MEVVMQDRKREGRWTGWLYLVVIVCAGFSQGGVRESILVAGNAAQTAQNILQSETLFRWGLITDLIAFSTDVAISILLFQMLKSVNKTLALVMAAFRLLAHPAVGLLNLLNQYAALHVLKSPSLVEHYTPQQINEAAQFFMGLHHMGYLLAGVLFAFHCLLLGYLLTRSKSFPSLLGVGMVVASMGYLIESFGFLLVPEQKVLLGWIVGVTAVVGEVSLCLWLIIKGANTVKE